MYWLSSEIHPAILRNSARPFPACSARNDASKPEKRNADAAASDRNQISRPLPLPRRGPFHDRLLLLSAPALPQLSFRASLDTARFQDRIFVSPSSIPRRSRPDPRYRESPRAGWSQDRK